MFTYSLFIINNFFMSETFSHPDVLCSPGGGEIGRKINKQLSCVGKPGGSTPPPLGRWKGGAPAIPMQAVHPIHSSIHLFPPCTPFLQSICPHLAGSPSSPERKSQKPEVWGSPHHLFIAPILESKSSLAPKNFFRWTDGQRLGTLSVP